MREKGVAFAITKSGFGAQSFTMTIITINFQNNNFYLQ